MKRMTENAISYYTVTPNDIKNILAQGEGLFKYTPSPEFIEVIHDFKSVLIVDWMKIAENISHIIGAPLSILYPIGKSFLTDEGDLGYAYFGGQMTKMVNPTFFELEGTYYIQWPALTA